MADENVEADHSCPICMRLLYEPVRLQCNHAYCLLCIKHLLRSNPKKACPMCRANLEDFDQENAVPDQALHDKLKKLYPTTWAERHKEFLEDMDNERHKIIKKLIVGNDCKQAPGKRAEWKEWTLYLHFEGQEDPVEAGKYLEKVVVNLHPTFNPPTLVFKKPPFEVTRVGWGVFEITMTLYFQPHTQKKPIDIEWFLSFRPGGRHKVIDLEFDDRFVPS